MYFTIIYREIRILSKRNCEKKWKKYDCLLKYTRISKINKYKKKSNQLAKNFNKLRKKRKYFIISYCFHSLVNKSRDLLYLILRELQFGTQYFIVYTILRALTFAYVWDVTLTVTPLRRVYKVVARTEGRRAIIRTVRFEPARRCRISRPTIVASNGRH